MKRLALIALALAPALAFAQLSAIKVAMGPAAAATQTANHASANVPTAAGDGVPLSGISGCRFVLSAASGQTLSGAGTLRFWYYDSVLARWMRNQDVTVSVSTSAVRDMVTQDYAVLVSSGRLYVEAVSVTSSSGALTVTAHCWRK
jgi:hypothetical protein